VVGLRGEIVVEPTGDDASRFSPGTVLRVEVDPPREVSVAARRSFRKALAIRFEGIERVEEAEALCGAVLTISEELLPRLPDGVYYHYQLIGLEVVDAGGKPLGRLVSVLQTGSNDVYCVGGGPDEILIPAIRDYVAKVDLEAGRILLAVDRSRLGLDEAPV